MDIRIECSAGSVSAAFFMVAEEEPLHLKLCTQFLFTQPPARATKLLELTRRAPACHGHGILFARARDRDPAAAAR